MKVNEIITEGWWDDLKRKITGGGGDTDAAAGLQRFDQNVQGRLTPAYQEWAGVAKNTQLPVQPGESTQAYAQRRAQYLSGALKKFADELYKGRQPSGGTRIPTPNLTGNETADLKAARDYLTSRIQEYFSTINVDAETGAQAAPAAQQQPAPTAQAQLPVVTAPAVQATQRTSTIPGIQYRPAGRAVVPARPQAIPPREKYMGPVQQVQPQQLQSPVRRLPR